MWIGTLSAAALNSGTCASASAQNPFMSTAPRPNALPSATRSVNGSEVQLWPATGTTSVCPERTTPPIPAGPMVATSAALSPAAFGRRRDATPCPARWPCA